MRREDSRRREGREDIQAPGLVCLALNLVDSPRKHIHAALRPNALGIVPERLPNHVRSHAFIYLLATLQASN